MFQPDVSGVEGVDALSGVDGCVAAKPEGGGGGGIEGFEFEEVAL